MLKPSHSSLAAAQVATQSVLARAIPEARGASKASPKASPKMGLHCQPIFDVKNHNQAKQLLQVCYSEHMSKSFVS